MNQPGICARREYDWTILLLAVVLTAIGIVMVYSSSTEMADTLKRYRDELYFLKRQLVFATLGFGLMALAMRIDYHKLQRWAVVGLLFCMLLLIAVFIPGLSGSAGGASRWLRVGFNLQPAELAKIALIVYLAYSLTKKKDKILSFKLGIVPYSIVLAVLIGLLMCQPDLGSAATLFAVAAVMLFVAGIRISHIVSIILLAAPIGIYLVTSSSYRMNRIAAYLNPWQDPTGKGFQIIQSWIAVGNGGIFGKGLGEGRQKLFYLPEAHTDFILSVIGEELGFIGIFVVAALFLILVWRGLRTAQSATDAFGRHLAFGITFLLGFEAFFNMSVVLGLLPTKGLALPFVSYGGSNLVCTLLATGILLNISSQATTQEVLR